MIWRKKGSKKINIINFYCKRCKKDFDCEVGRIDFCGEMPKFEKAVICNRCSAKYIDGESKFAEYFELTEIGQSQLTELFLNVDIV